MRQGRLHQDFLLRGSRRVHMNRCGPNSFVTKPRGAQNLLMNRVPCSLSDLANGTSGMKGLRRSLQNYLVVETTTRDGSVSSGAGRVESVSTMSWPASWISRKILASERLQEIVGKGT